MNGLSIIAVSCLRARTLDNAGTTPPGKGINFLLLDLPLRTCIAGTPLLTGAHVKRGVLIHLPFCHDRHIELEELGRVDISGGIQASLAGRYALALFELARDSKQIDSVGQSLFKLKAALEQSEDFRALTTSPLIGRDAAAAAVTAVGESLQLDPLTKNFLGVLAENRRLAQIGGIIRSFTLLVSNHKGETTAEVTSAHPLNDDQIAALAAQLRSRVGRDVAIELKVDPEILGGLKVKVGSQLIDSSIRTRLNTLAQAMKG